MLGTKELTQYFLTDNPETPTLIYQDEGNIYRNFLTNLIDVYLDHVNDGIRLQLIFKRRLTTEAMTTFFPSVLLIAITYSTTFFKPFFFEAIVSVNLTVQ